MAFKVSDDPIDPDVGLHQFHTAQETSHGHTLKKLQDPQNRRKPETLGRPRTPESSADRRSFPGLACFDPTESKATVVQVGFDSPRDIGESRPWLQWIVDHYDSRLSGYAFHGIPGPEVTSSPNSSVRMHHLVVGPCRVSSGELGVVIDEVTGRRACRRG